MSVPITVAAVALALLLSGGAVSRAQNAPPGAPITAATVAIRLDPDSPTVMLGEPTFLSFTVDNLSKEDLQLASGTNSRFEVKITAEDGSPVALLPQPNAFSYPLTSDSVPSGGSYAFRIFLPAWAVFEKTGRYRIVVRKVLELGKDSHNARGPRMLGQTDIPAEASTQLQIVASDPARMGVVIETFANQMLASKDSRPLAAIHDERAIPYWLRAVESRDYDLKFSALQGLAAYNDDRALAAIKAAMDTTGKDLAGSTSSPTTEASDGVVGNIRVAAAQALLTSPHPGALPILLGYQNDPFVSVRFEVLAALVCGKVKREEAMPRLRQLATDPDSRLSGEAKRWLEEFK